MTTAEEPRDNSNEPRPLENCDPTTAGRTRSAKI